MRKTNTMKSLKIKNKKIKIQNIQEVTGITDQVKQVGAPAVRTLKNIALSAAQFSKFTTKTVLSPITYYIMAKYKNEEPSLKGWAKDLGKNLDDLSDDVSNLTKNFDNNFKSMLNDIGMTENEMNVLIAVGSPPLAISNAIYDALNNKRGSFAGDLDKLKNIENVLEKIAFFISLFITGKSPSNDKTSEVLNRKIFSEIQSFIKGNFSEATYRILSKINNSSEWDMHSEEIISILGAVYKNINQEAMMSNPINEFLRIRNKITSTSNLDKIIEDIKKYCDTNVNKLKKSSYQRSLNLKTKLITEKLALTKETNAFAFSFATILFIKKSEPMLDAAYRAEFGSEYSKQEVKKLITVMKNKNNLMTHLQIVYSHFVVAKFVLKLADEIIKDKNYDVEKETPALFNQTLNDYVKILPSPQKRVIEDALTQQRDTILQMCRKPDFVNKKLEKTKDWVDSLEDTLNLPIFNYEGYREGASRISSLA